MYMYLGSARIADRHEANAYCGYPSDGCRTMCITGPTALSCWSHHIIDHTLVEQGEWLSKKILKFLYYAHLSLRSPVRGDPVRIL